MRTYYGKQIMKNIRETLLEHKKTYHLTNKEIAQKCDISIAEYDKIMNVKTHSNQGCSIDTVYKICKNTDIDINTILMVDINIIEKK